MSSDPRIYPSLLEYTPLFNKFICATLPQSTPPSENIPPFSTNLYVRPSQNLPLPLRIYPPFQHLYATLPESTPPSHTPLLNRYIIMRRSQSQPLPPRIRPLSATTCDTTLPTIKYPPFLTTVLYATLPESTPLSEYTLPPSFTTICDVPRIYPQSLNMPPFLELHVYVRESTTRSQN